MALKGTLKDFGLSDIFQLISHQRKTGVLHLEEKGRSVAVTFDEGRVVQAEAGSEKTREKERVGDILIKSGVLSSGQLDEALKEQARTMKKLGVILLEKRFLTQQIFQEALSFQVKATLFKLFMWTGGTYRFEVGQVAYDKQFMTPLPAEYVLMEAARIIDEWPGVKSRIPSMDAVFARAQGAENKVLRRSQIKAPAAEADADFDILGEEKKPKSLEGDKVILSAAMERVFDLVNGQWTVTDIAYRSLLGDFEACKALVELSSHGLVKAIKVPVSTPRADEAVKEKRNYRSLIYMALGALAVGTVFILLLSRLSGTGGALSPLAQLTSDKAVAMRASLAQAQVRRLNLAMEVYRLEKGAYPASSGELANAGLVLASDVSYPYAKPYRIEPREKGPVILPAE